VLNEKHIRIRSLLVIFIFAVIIGGLALFNIIIESPSMLISERRVPTRRPLLTLCTVISSDFMDDFEGYVADNFPFRERFRTLRAVTVFGLFLQTDKDGIYFDSHGIGSFQATDHSSVDIVARKIQVVADGLGDLNIFYAFIPDKSIYAERTMPGFDVALVETTLRNRMSNELTFISLVDALDANSFYRTDLHWNQANINGVLDALSEAMGIEINLSQFTRENAGLFLGVYAGQLALPMRSENMYVLENPSLTAFYLNVITRELEVGLVYNIERFNGIDPYDIFLSGAQPIIVLENPNATSDRHLYLFRDSFGSSIAPLLASAYSRVTLLDLRFLDVRTMHQLIDFKPGSDALFLYSSVILNNSDSLLIPLVRE